MKDPITAGQEAYEQFRLEQLALGEKLDRSDKRTFEIAWIAAAGFAAYVERLNLDPPTHY